MDIAKWMTKSLITIKPKDTLRHARERLAKYRINQMPVVVGDKLVGIVTDRDVRDAYPSSLRLFHGKDIDEFGDSHTVEEIMTYNVVTVTPQTSLRETAQRLRQQRFGALPVVDNGKLVGIITRSDVLDAMLAEEMGEE
jgi:acetoin utilization protein AcuB